MGSSELCYQYYQNVKIINNDTILALGFFSSVYSFALPLSLAIKQHWIQFSVSVYKRDKYGYVLQLTWRKKKV